MAERHNYWQCANRACRRIDREVNCWRRFAESGGIGSCRGCGGNEFYDRFIPTARELDLIRRGAFANYENDPYFVDLDPRILVAESPLPQMQVVHDRMKELKLA